MPTIQQLVKKGRTSKKYKSKFDFSSYNSKPILKKIVLSDYLDNSKEYIIKN